MALFSKPARLFRSALLLGTSEYVVPVKSTVETLQSFVVFPEYMNFTGLKSQDFQFEACDDPLLFSNNVSHPSLKKETNNRQIA